jgi:UDP-GlcNAc:undecaprenyl-phosphate GlcNAc-1-phosphate transferase
VNRVYILAFLISLLASFLLTPYVKKLAFKIGALDKPEKRKVHTQVMPRLGGLAIYSGFLLSVLCTVHINKDVLGMLLGGTVIMIVGVIDDKYSAAG